ncbi:MAG: aldose 1-epimerase family protein [Chitinophagaceae bacterium]
MIFIENELLKVTINPKGAELTSLFHKKKLLEYMWNGDPAFWGKRSPVLFPIIGELKESGYFFENTFYKMGRHGFAREMVFVEEHRETGSVIFLLRSSEDTLKIFPFNFEFRITYSLNNSQLRIKYDISNIGNSTMYFSVGAHPAFALPLLPGSNYQDYYLEFETEETINRWLVSKQGLIEKESVPFLVSEKTIPLTKELFYKDAIVLRNLKSNLVSLKSPITQHGFTFDFNGFPYLGIWAAKNADFVCIEPWCGIADGADSDQQLVKKEGINSLKPAAVFSRTWSVELW